MPIEIGKTYVVRLPLLAENRDDRGFVGLCTAVESGTIVTGAQESTATLCTLESEDGDVLVCIPGELEEVYTTADMEIEGQMLATFEKAGVQLEIVYSAKGYTFRSTVTTNRYSLLDMSHEDIRNQVQAAYEALLEQGMTFCEDHARHVRRKRR